MLASAAQGRGPALPDVQVPPILDPSNSEHVSAVYGAIEASTSSPNEEVRRPAEATLKACERSDNYTGVLLAVVASSAPSHVRVVAVILLKNLVNACWRSRGGANKVISDSEKEFVRKFLLLHLDEHDKTVAVQLAVLVAKVRQDQY